MSVVADPVVPAPFRWSDGQLALDLEHGHVLFTTRRGGVSGGPYASLNLGPWTDDDPGAWPRTASAWPRWPAGAGSCRGTRSTARRVAVDGRARRGRRRPGRPPTPGVAPIVLVGRLPAGRPGRARAPSALVHAGWRGLAGGILARAAGAVRGLAGDEAPVAAAIGPGAGPCCYEVGDDLRARFGTSGRTLDLTAIAAGALHAAGVGEVHDSGLCTICDPQALSSPIAATAASPAARRGIAWRS